MTPKEKAVRLVDRYLDEVFNEVNINFPLELPKRLATIAVDEIIFALNDDIYIQGETDIDSHREYWQEVKQEIEKL